MTIWHESTFLLYEKHVIRKLQPVEFSWHRKYLLVFLIFLTIYISLLTYFITLWSIRLTGWPRVHATGQPYSLSCTPRMFSSQATCLHSSSAPLIQAAPLASVASSSAHHPRRDPGRTAGDTGMTERPPCQTLPRTRRQRPPGRPPVMPRGSGVCGSNNAAVAEESEGQCFQKA
jgi:hypothetical protein